MRSSSTVNVPCDKTRFVELSTAATSKVRCSFLSASPLRPSWFALPPAARDAAALLLHKRPIPRRRRNRRCEEDEDGDGWVLVRPQANIYHTLSRPGLGGNNGLTAQSTQIEDYLATDTLLLLVMMCLIDSKSKAWMRCKEVGKGKGGTFPQI